MSDTSRTVLNAFTRKLANCRHTVSLKALMNYFDEGKFGYTYDVDDDEVITNEYVFADDIATLVSHIRTIFRRPRMFLKKENIVQNAAVATKMDIESTRETYRDPKIWKVTETSKEPEYVHSFVNEDNYAVYENRFICALIDKVFETVGKKLREVYATLDTLGQKVGEEGTVGFSSRDFLEFSENGEKMPKLIPAKSPIADMVASLAKSKKQLLAFKGRQLYVDCKKAGGFTLTNVRPTNVLIFDAEYNFCYNFYLHYLFREPVLAKEQQRYYNFVTVNFLRAMQNAGWKATDENPMIAVTNSFRLRFDPVHYEKGLFHASVSLGDNDVIYLSVGAKGQEESAKYEFHVFSKEKADETEDFYNVNSYARKLAYSREHGITHAFIISQSGWTDEDNAACIDPAATDTQEKLMRLIKTCVMVAQGAKAIHSRFCPVCGSTLVSFDGADYSCQGCQTFFRIFGDENGEYVWLKRLARYERPYGDVDDVPEIQEENAIRVKLRARRKK